MESRYSVLLSPLSEVPFEVISLQPLLIPCQRVSMNSSVNQAEEPIWCRRPTLVVAIWLLLSCLIGITGVLTGAETRIPGPTNTITLLENVGEARAFRAGLPPKDVLILVLEHKVRSIEDPLFLRVRDSLYDLLTSLQYENSPVFESVQTAGHTMLGDEHFISDGQRGVLFKADTTVSIDHSEAALKRLPGAIEGWYEQNEDFSDFQLGYLSDGTVNNEMFALIDADLHSSLIYTLPLSILILLWVFGSVVSALIPIVVSLVSLFASLGVMSLLSKFLGPVSATAAQLVVLLVLAIGIDYSLFLSSRLREEMERGLGFRQGVTVARSSTGVAILWSGVIVALSLSGLFLMEDTILASMALVSIVAVGITVVSAVFVLPSLLLLLEHYFDAGRIRPLASRKNTKESPRRWWLSFAIERPLLAALLSAGFLCCLSYYAFQIKLGSTVEPRLLPSSTQSYKAFHQLETSFPDLAGIDFSVLLWNDSGESIRELEDEGELVELFDSILAFDRVRGPIKTEFSEDGRVARFQFIAVGGGNVLENQRLVHHLREEVFPGVGSSLSISSAMGGTLPYVVDDIDRYLSRTPLVFGVVVLLSVGLLLLAFRSVVIPFKALFLNVFSTLSAFGVLVLVFQKFNFVSIHYEIVESFVPPLLFSILFGLSMDYHVFLMARVNEEFLSRNDTKEAVRVGIERTFHTITSAALIMVSVFGVIASLELPIMKELGIGLAVAVLVDATIIRCLLLPASLVLLGRWNWYLPRCLNWLPRLESFGGEH